MLNETESAYPERETPTHLAERLKLPFDDLRLLTRALTHRSYVNEHSGAIEDNERLEFLGDAVLDFVVGSWVYNSYPEMREGSMTRMRSALVRTESLAAIARQLGLGNALRLGRGELSGGGRDRDPLLCGAFEALIGAMYQHKGLDVARDFVLPLLQPVADQLIMQMNTIDPKSRLQEWSQGKGLGIPRYVQCESEGPEHAKTFIIEVHIQDTCYGRGSGPSKSAASQAAAVNALEKIEEQG